MCRNLQCTMSGTQRGFSLVLAMMIILICGLLAGALININSIGADSVAREVLSTRALLAAETGAQRKLNQVLQPVALANCVATNWVMNGCNIAVNCTPFVADSVNYIQVTATGRCPAGNPDAAVRVIEVGARLTL